ncbi:MULTISPECIES: alanine racemase [unclassified Bradyrhizobium]|uniref:alanine racemase n=1 Tax=unclassified Bradyrhizobium TaxID=2631580 RepID=UPI001FFAA093|nr:MULTISPECIES: alanine racemase [unclassified Bradyrhizobium]MCK1612603.1 alanine racemase [Bradyrhizobium sp. 163]MCK1766374.1 alanine racemase [Bradyrhizobium sp. 136]
MLFDGKSQGFPGYMTVDLAALRRNFERIASMVNPACVAGVVKADAYGLGAIRVAGTLLDAGCRHLFMAQAEEAIALRPHLSNDAELFALNGLLPGAEAACASAQVIPVINSLTQLHRWRTQARSEGRLLSAVLQFDTGMSRLGFAPAERAAVRMEIEQSPELEVLYVMSHLASADEPTKGQNAAQLAEMQMVTKEFAPAPSCFANSAGVLMGKDYHGALVRPGIALYGGAPQVDAANPMEPVVSLSIAVAQTRTVPRGTMVGYSGTRVTSGSTRLATLCAGYADGLPRSLSSRGAVYFHGQRLPIVGRVSMDSMTVDISGLPDDTLDLGSLVEVIGPHQTLEMLAADAGTISYEILTGLGHRFCRSYR